MPNSPPKPGHPPPGTCPDTCPGVLPGTGAEVKGGRDAGADGPDLAAGIEPGPPRIDDGGPDNRSRTDSGGPDRRSRTRRPDHGCGPDGWPADLPPPVLEQPLDGGHIGRTTRATLADGRIVVVKRCPYPAAQEADGLRALASTGMPVPVVVGVAARTLVLEHVSGQPDWTALGRAVARLHRHTADRFGWPTDNYAGRFCQDNAWTADWPTFYTERRVLHHLSHADVPDELRIRIRNACSGPLQELLRPAPPASLTHGDLWLGNMIDGRWVVDPAVSYADRELDLAYLSLSDDLPPEFMAAYRDEYPIEPDFEDRRPALLLHKHLVNVRHFGDRILPRLAATLNHYGW